MAHAHPLFHLWHWCLAFDFHPFYWFAKGQAVLRFSPALISVNLVSGALEVEISSGASGQDLGRGKLWQTLVCRGVQSNETAALLKVGVALAGD